MKKLLLALLFLFPISASALPILTVPQGGTGSSTLTSILIGNGTGAMQSLIIGSGLSLSGTTLSNSGASFSYPFPNNSTTSILTFTNPPILGTLTGLIGGNSGTLYNVSTSTITLGTLTLDTALTVANGGTGAATLTGCLTGNGTSAITGSGTCATFGWPFTNSASWVSTSTLFNLAGGVMSTASSSFQYFNSASSSVDVLLVNTRLGIATSTPGNGAVLGVTGSGFFSGDIYATNIYDTGLTGSNCVGETGGLIGAGTNCVTSIAQTYGSAQNGVIVFGTSTTAISGDWGITNSSGTFTLNIPSASASVRGLLTSTDWTTFNNSADFGWLFTNSATWVSTSTIFNLAGGVMSTASSTFQDLKVGSLSVTDTTFTGATDFSLSTVTIEQQWAFSLATTTAWTGTTTRALGPAYSAQTWKGVKCFTDTGTLQVSFNDGTNRMNWFNASTTVGAITLTSNNAFSLGEKRYVDIGTPASSPTAVSCSVSVLIND